MTFQLRDQGRFQTIGNGWGVPFIFWWQENPTSYLTPSSYSRFQKLGRILCWKHFLCAFTSPIFTSGNPDPTRYCVSKPSGDIHRELTPSAVSNSLSTGHTPPINHGVTQYKLQAMVGERNSCQALLEAHEPMRLTKRRGCIINFNHSPKLQHSLNLSIRTRSVRLEDATPPEIKRVSFYTGVRSFPYELPKAFTTISQGRYHKALWPRMASLHQTSQSNNALGFHFMLLSLCFLPLKKAWLANSNFLY